MIKQLNTSYLHKGQLTTDTDNRKYTHMFIIQYLIFLQGSILELSAGARIKARVARRNSSNSKPFHFNFDFDMSGSLNKLSLVNKNIHRMKLISVYSVSWQNIFFTASKYGLKLSKYRFIKKVAGAGWDNSQKGWRKS